MRCLCCLVPWLHAWPPWWLYWCLCVGGWWWLHLGWLLLWWTPCCLSFAAQDCWIETGLGANILPSVQRATILPFPTISSPSLLRKNNCNLRNQQYIYATKHQAHLCRINLSRGAAIFSRNQHPAQHLMRQQEHLLCLQEHLYFKNIC